MSIKYAILFTIFLLALNACDSASKSTQALPGESSVDPVPPETTEPEPPLQALPKDMANACKEKQVLSSEQLNQLKSSLWLGKIYRQNFARQNHFSLQFDDNLNATLSENLHGLSSLKREAKANFLGGKSEILKVSYSDEAATENYSVFMCQKEQLLVLENNDLDKEKFIYFIRK